MFSDLTPGIVLAILGITLYKILELYARRKERLNLIEKLSENNPDLKLDLSFKSGNAFSSLKIGLLLVGVGIGCLVGIILQTSCTDSLSLQFDRFGDQVRYNIEALVGTIYFASISTFGGIGLVIAYLIEKRDKKDS
jgi:hypothetical protein